jgi:hypothetical protein
VDHDPVSATMPINRSALVVALVAAAGVGSSIATNPPDAALPVVVGDEVTVSYRGKAHVLTGKTAEEIRDAALALLRSSCKERPLRNDDNARRLVESARRHPHVLLTFVKPRFVPRAGNNKGPVEVRSLVIPFHPDFDPEVVFVLPGKPFRAFDDMGDGSESIRAALIRAGIYPYDNDPKGDKPNWYEAVGALEKRGAGIRKDATRPDFPVIGVYFPRTACPVTDEDLNNLRAFPDLKNVGIDGIDVWKPVRR